MGLAEFVGEVLGIFGDVNLRPQGEESGCDRLKVLEGGVLPFCEHPEEGIHVSGIDEHVPDEGRDRLDVSMGSSLEGGEIFIFYLEVALLGARGHGRFLPVSKGRARVRVETH
jgi:hypothetical protein